MASRKRERWLLPEEIASTLRVELAKVMDLAIAPHKGMTLHFLDGASAVIGNVAQEERAWLPGVHSPRVHVRMDCEAADRYEKAVASGWAPASPLIS